MGRSEAPRPTAGPEPTRALLDRVRYGDHRALLEVYSRYLRPLQRWVRCRVPAWARRRLDTDDIVEKTLLESLDTGGLGQAEIGSFQTCLRYKILERIREELRRAARAGTFLTRRGGRGNGRESLLEQSVGREACAQYESALHRLDDADREAIIARFELGLSYQQIAFELDKSHPEEARRSIIEALLHLAEAMRGAT